MPCTWGLKRLRYVCCVMLSDPGSPGVFANSLDALGMATGASANAREGGGRATRDSADYGGAQAASALLTITRSRITFTWQ